MAKALLLLGSLLLSLLILECGVGLIVRHRGLDVYTPSYDLANVGSRFWTDMSEAFGPWHPPGSEFRHVRSCFDVRYRANSHGMRDRERSLEGSGAPRVVVLGDSFVEGFGVERAERMTDLVEAELGVEMLNFGTSGDFGPTQYLLLYRSLASRFEHDAVLVGLLPDNDFTDDDYEHGLEHSSDRYRPYFVGEAPDYRLVYFQDSLDKSVSARGGVSQPLKATLREFSFTFNAVRFLRRTRRREAKTSRDVYSGYWDHEPGQLARLEYVLTRLREEVGDRPLIVAALPRLQDLHRYDREGEAPLTRALGGFLPGIGVEYLDLLPPMHAATDAWESYFLVCNPHWGPAGHAEAARHIAPRISRATISAAR